MRRRWNPDHVTQCGLALACASLLALAAAVPTATPGEAAPDDSLSKQLVGIWQFVSHKRFKTGTESVKHGGYLRLRTDGSASYFFVDSDYDAATNDAKRQSVLRAMLRWSGKYSVQDGKLVIENPHRTVSRQFEIDGDNLTTLPLKRAALNAVGGGTAQHTANFGETILTRVR